MNGLSRFVRVHESVLAAVASRRPCVALESTIITHGLPYPANLRTALACEDAIRKEGAVPATVALLDGIAHVGLDRGQLERIAEAASSGKTDTRTKLIKAGRRDLATVLALGRDTIGGTTVSGTMVLAHHAGIPIFATGGIGGVHRGAESTMDISADLTELSRTPVSVFCSGAKSILSLPLTLEYLETAGVTVTSFHPGGRFPAFYSQDSGLDVTPVRDISHAADIIHASTSLGLQNGIVFGVPIPDSYAPAAQEIQLAVEQAVRESIEQGIDKRGKEVTPWLLARVSQLTDKALASNMALVINNSHVAAQTAVRYCSIRDVSHEDSHSGATPSSFMSSTSQTEKRQTFSQRFDGASILVVGAAAVDISAQAHGATSQNTATTHPGRISLSPGGVARNVAEAASRLLQANLGGSRTEQSSRQTSISAVKLIAPIADDAFGAFLQDEADRAGMRQDGFYIMKASSSGSDDGKHVPRTSVCTLSLDNESNLLHGVADFESTSIPPATVAQDEAVSETARESSMPRQFAQHLGDCLSSLHGPQKHSSDAGPHPIVAFDANLGPDVLQQLIMSKQTHSSQFPPRAPVLLYEPTSLPKCSTVLVALKQCMLSSPDLFKAGPTAERPLIDICTPNRLELMGLHAAAVELGLVHPARRVAVDMAPGVQEAVSDEILLAANDLSSLFGWIFLKREKHGVTVFRRVPSAQQEGAVNVATSIPQDGGVSVMKVTQHPVPHRLQPSEIGNTTGAGDTFAGALIAGVALMGPPSSWSQAGLDDLVSWAQHAAACTVRSTLSVAPELSNLTFITRK
ncbi:unnamed protein product [Tilletia laevis]|uniref:Carbohydrate kinase PfkB domain-containing protein n=2 Tax=Tilletia TaxID=13289 RepID=A0A9N8LIA4_9BASI|nr:unnamed protein product [Tilletia caries]CAD6915913.1 unnamed protein product [Tilletia laevis]CAD6921774.1 unnamed protein product [Tilletia laevis]CAD6925343.1 unnamed protein product [Tilletia caries]CAD6953182.1 unnamed protein product [Tilletia caries]